MTELSRTVGTVAYDKLIAGLSPSPVVASRTIRGLVAETTYLRGTVFAKSSVDNKVVVLGTAADVDEVLTPDCVLTDDITVAANTDEIMTFYEAARVNIEALIVKDGYTLTATDKDKLRERGIFISVIL